MSKTKRLVMGLVVVVLVIAGVLAIVIPMLVDVDRYRPQVTARLQQQTGKPTQIGHLGLSIFPQVAIRVDDFALANPPGFPAGDFVKAQRIYAVMDPGALWHRQVVIRSLELDSPEIHLLSNGHGKWNFESPPVANATPSQPPGEDKASFTLGVISKVRIAHGEFTSANVLPSGTAGPSVMEAQGASIDLQDVALQAFTTASLRSTDPSGLALLEGLFSSTVYAAADQTPQVAHGTIKADTLKFGHLVVAKLNSKLQLYPKRVLIDDLQMQCYGGRVSGDLSLDFGGPSLTYKTDAQLKGVDVAQSLDAFPQARGMMTGTLDGSIRMVGEVINSPDPLAGMDGSGLITIHNGKMPSLQLDKNLRTLARIADLGPANGDPSSFSSISADFKVAGARLSSNRIALVGNGVDVDGSGNMTMAGQGNLDYQGTASLAASASNPLTNLVASLSGATMANGKLAFPFGVSGTLAHPKFAMKGGAAGQGASAQTGAEQPADLVRGLAGLFKKKKQQ